jgi:plasmid replication initiation protein
VLYCEEIPPYCEEIPPYCEFFPSKTALFELTIVSLHFYYSQSIFIFAKKIRRNYMDLNIILRQDNKLTTSKQDFTPIEKRCLYYVIKEVRRLYVEKDVKEGDTVYQNLFSDMYLKLKSEQLQQLADEVKDVYNALKRLVDKKIEIDNEDVWLYTSWILKVRHEKKGNYYEVQVSKDILPYFVELARQFTEYSLIVAIGLKSTYSQRFYELCCMYRNKGKFYLEVEKMRYIFKLENKKSYSNTAIIKRDILDVAQKELQMLFEAGQSDLYFTYRVKDREKRKILSYWFDVHTRESEERKRLDFETVQAQIRRILEICRTFIKRDEKYLKRIENQLHLTPNHAAEILEKLNRKVNDYSRKEIPLIIRYVFREDYGIK